MNEEKQTNSPHTREQVSRKPISYHPALCEGFDAWALACGWNEESLRRSSEEAIRTRHHQAIIEHESHRVRGAQPDIFTLSLGSVDVYYTVEELQIVIRGYGYETAGDPLDDWDGGIIFLDSSWQAARLRSTSFSSPNTADE